MNLLYLKQHEVDNHNYLLNLLTNSNRSQSWKTMLLHILSSRSFYKRCPNIFFLFVQSNNNVSFIFKVNKSDIFTASSKYCTYGNISEMT